MSGSALLDPGRPRAWSSLLRAAAMSTAAVSLAWGIALPSGLTAAIAGAALGVPLGNALGRSRLRLVVSLVAVLALAVLAFGLAAFVVRYDLVPAHIGTGNALRAAAAIRFGAASLAATALLRTIAARRPEAAAVEVIALAAAIPTVFASHRDGVIARPLWISDYAWQRGIDPTYIFLGLGAAAVAVLAVLLLVETRSGKAFSSLIAVAVLALLAVVVIPLIGIPVHDPLPALGLTDSADGGTPSDAGAFDAGNGVRPELADGGVPVRPELGDAGELLDGGGSLGGDAGVMDASAEESDGGPSVAPSEHLDESTSKSEAPSPVAVVVLDDDYSPPSQGYYLRQDAWSEWTGTRLVHAQTSGIDEDLADGFPQRDTEVRDPPPEVGRAKVHALVALLVDHAQPFALESAWRFSPAPNPNPTRFLRAYRFESLAQTANYNELIGHKAGNPAWSPAVRAHYLEAPSDPRYGELARRIVAKVPPSMRGDPFGTALTVKLYLDDRFKYSMRFKHAGVADPTADFLFGDRTGYCVHFAHAAALLWRTLGIPARVAAGYRSEEDDRHGSSTILVRGGDAHAWPELYLEGAGWIVLDIAPKQNLDPPAPPVDPELQRLLGEMARRMPPSPTSTALEDTARLSRYGREFVFFNLLLLAGVAAILYAIKLWRRVAPWVLGPAALPVAGYRSALDMLSDVGVARRFGETREAFARRVSELSPSFGALTAKHVEAALGGPGAARPKSDADKAAWRAGVSAVRGEIGRGIKRWRRVMGVVNPASFIRSR